MTGVISLYAMQQFLDGQKPPFTIPQTTLDKARAVQATAHDTVCERCRALFQLLLDKIDNDEDLDTFTHHGDILQLATSAQRCAMCIHLLKVVFDQGIPDPLPSDYKTRPLRMGFVNDEMDALVSPVAKGVLQFSYTGPSDALAGRYFQVDLGEDWTNKFPGRRLAERAPLGLVRQWLAQCSSGHLKCPRIKDKEMPTRLVDTGELTGEMSLRLVQSGEGATPRLGKYLALSHCWGTEPPKLITETKNLADHLQTIKYEELSNNFQDAVAVTRKLGYRYLWVDSLCIIQDSVEDWRRECIKMEAVYSNAAITIAASGAKNSQQGFLGPRIPQMACFVTLQHRDGDTVKLRVSRLSNGQLLTRDDNTAVLDTRAWALQERLLSRRVLSFGKEQLSFECCSARFFESSHFPLKSPSSDRENWLMNLDSIVDSKNGAVIGELPKPQDFYQQLGPYTYRFLTRAGDKLPAAGGFARRYASLTGDQYIAGLWRSDLLLGLLWQANWHHGENEKAQVPRYEYDNEALKCLPPSWSWASCELPINFQQSTHTGSLMEIIKCEASLVSEDVYGQVNGGVLEVEGWTIECEADEVDYRPHWWGEDLRGDVCGEKAILFARLFRDRPRGNPSPYDLPTSDASAHPIAPNVDQDDAALHDMTETLVTMGFPEVDSRTALIATHKNVERAITHLVEGIPDNEEADDLPPALPPRPTMQTSSARGPNTLTCLVVSRSFPVSWTPGWSWCGLALEPAEGHVPNTYRRVGLIYASRLHGGRYNKIKVNPEESVESIQQTRKRRLCII